MKQTAVEWLEKELESYGDPQFCEIKWKQLDLLMRQAKEMEKQQIIDADVNGSFRTAEALDRKISSFGVKELAQQYYEETFNKG